VASLGAQLEAVGPSMDARFSDVTDRLGEQDERQGQALGQLRTDMDTRTGALSQALDALTQELRDHAHDYLTGTGEGHNVAVVTTSPPKKVKQ
jgi:hypothetical protein